MNQEIVSKPIIILDLDESIIRSIENPNKEQIQMCDYYIRKDQYGSDIAVFLRPFLIEFLNQMRQDNKFELGIFTAGTKAYADQILFYIEYISQEKYKTIQQIQQVMYDQTYNRPQVTKQSKQKSKKNDIVDEKVKNQKNIYQQWKQNGGLYKDSKNVIFNRQYIKYRNDCSTDNTGRYKDLSILTTNQSISNASSKTSQIQENILIVDDLVCNFRYQPSNGIPIKSFIEYDKPDMELIKLYYYLQTFDTKIPLSSQNIFKLVF